MLTENTDTLERLVIIAISDELLYTLCSRVVKRLTVSIPAYVNGFASSGELYKMSGILRDDQQKSVCIPLKDGLQMSIWPKHEVQFVNIP